MSKAPMTSKTDTAHLQAAVCDMHALSEQGFNQIRSIAIAALGYMKTTDGYTHPENLARMFDAIWMISERYRDCITNHAQDVGQTYRDADYEHRIDAHRRAMEGGHDEQ